MKPSKTKVVCQVCVDGYSSENLELGKCCGKDLIVIPNENYEADVEIEERFRESVAKQAENLGW